LLDVIKMVLLSWVMVFRLYRCSVECDFESWKVDTRSAYGRHAPH